RLTTHNGMIAIAIPEKVNATLMVRTYNGSFRSTFPVKQDDQNPRKRLTLTLGNGSAHIELESFGGTIALRRPGEPRPEVERARQGRQGAPDVKDKDKDKDKGKEQAWIFGMPRDAQADIDRAVTEAMRDAQPEIDRAMREIQPEIDAAINEALRDV